MLGYDDWRDVRNDCLLLLGALKLWTLGYVICDWAMYPTQGSHVLWLLFKYAGPDSPIYRWAVQFWNHGFGR